MSALFPEGDIGSLGTGDAARHGTLRIHDANYLKLWDPMCIGNECAERPLLLYIK